MPKKNKTRRELVILMLVYMMNEYKITWQDIINEYKKVADKDKLTDYALNELERSKGN